MVKRQLLIIVVIYAAFSVGVIWYYQIFPVVSGTDAWFYLATAGHFRQNGVLAGLENIRTYGYPFSLYLLTYFVGLSPFAIAFAARVTQLVLYGAVVCSFANKVARDGAPTIAVTIAAGLLLNPVLVALVSDILSEAPTLILTVFMLLCLYGSARAATTRDALVWAAAGAAASNFALMVRPANLTVLIAWNIGLAVSLLVARAPDVHRVSVAAGYAVAWLATATAAWTPQVVHNMSLGHVGVLPASNLFREQLLLGTLFMRYDSVLIRHDAVSNADGLFVANPWCVAPWPALTWYLDHPLEGLGTVAGHLASAFTFNHLFTIIYDWDAFYSRALAGLMWVVVSLGALHSARLLAWHRLTSPPERAATSACVIALFVLGLGVLAFVAIENRFAAIPLAILSVLAVHFVVTYQGKPRGAYVFALVVAALGVSIAERQQNAAFELPDRSRISEYRCF